MAVPGPTGANRGLAEQERNKTASGRGVAAIMDVDIVPLGSTYRDRVVIEVQRLIGLHADSTPGSHHHALSEITKEACSASAGASQARFENLADYHWKAKEVKPRHPNPASGSRSNGRNGVA